MNTTELVLRQRAELVRALCCGGTSEGLESILDLLLSWGVLVWEDYLSVCVGGKALSYRTRELLDLVYSKGDTACGLLLAAFSQVLPDAQKNNLSFGECSADKNYLGTPISATQKLLNDRPGLVTKLRNCVEGALDVLFEQGFLTSSECEEIQLPVYTSSQQVKL